MHLVGEVKPLEEGERQQASRSGNALLCTELASGMNVSHAARHTESNCVAMAVGDMISCTSARSITVTPVNMSTASTSMYNGRINTTLKHSVTNAHSGDAPLFREGM